MNKDIIYIDVEDDVTSVIGKVRSSKEKIVALVPPKTVGTLQSAVNLRLLQKAADNAGKRIVLITNNSGLTALAAGVKIPVAKNLQSKPEIPVAPEKPAEAEEDVIKGEELPVGELAAASAGAAAFTAAEPKASAPVSSDDDIVVGDMPDLETAVPAAAAATKVRKAGPRVPDFGRFRKWIFIGGGLIVAIILFFVFANIFWTNAKVVITADTSKTPIDLPLTLTTTGQTDPNTNTVQAASKTTQKTESVTFTPTGQKNIGNKATGTVKFSTNNIDGLGTIPAGTQLTAQNGSVFTTDQSVTLTIDNHNGATTPVTAVNGGTSSNGANGSVDGAPQDVNATLTGPTSGGTDNNVTVVTDSDIAKAESQLPSSNSDASSAKSQLTQAFGSDYIVIPSSFTTQPGNASSSPASGQQATTAKVTLTTTYSLVAIAKSQLSTVTTNYLNGQLSGNNQKIYDDGSKTATLTGFVTSPSGVMTIQLKATGKTGPNINTDTLKAQLVGKKTEEIKQQIQSIDGVKNVTVSISPFWKTTAPSADKIKISFDLNGND